jgi:CubicO group peptidase (beta-lactamase class C family)
MTNPSLSRRGVLGAGAVFAGPLAGPFALMAGAPALAATSAIDTARVDALVAAFMTRFEVPGASVAIVAPGGQTYAQGYGVRRLGRAERVDAHTLFAIGSNTKAFTAASLATLVDEGKVDWDAPVVRYLPEFRMYDPAVTPVLTVRDLLCHRSGLPLGGGDLLYFPASNHVTADVLTALPYLKPERGFRAGYAYDNILYIVAGLLIERVSGRTWRDYVTTRLLRPLGMNETVTSHWLLQTDNVAGRHGRVGPPVRGVGPMTEVPVDESPMIDAAGGVNASAADIVHWLRAQLDHGALVGGGRLWSEAQSKAMWTPETLVGATEGPLESDPTRSVLSAYALGWGVRDYRGERLISHSGGVSGQITQTALLPRRGVAVAVFTNVEEGTSGAMRNALLDLMLGAPSFDWVSAWGVASSKRTQEALASVGDSLVTPPPGGPSLALAAYAGRYRDPWYGDVVVTAGPSGLKIDFLPTPVFKSRLEPWGTDAFRTRFPVGAGEDALVLFHPEAGAVTRVTMKAFSPLADFSYDFQHLDFVRV